MRVPLVAALAVLTGAAACSPGSGPDGDRREARNDTAVEAAPINAGVEAPAAPAAAEAPSVAAAGPKAARRCGWLSNPTPGNWWLTDAEGQWILGTQGGDQAPGMDEMPDMSSAGWVETNGHYGYGCACMTITYDPAAEKVTRIADAQPKPLKQCKADRKLPKPE